MLAIGVLPFPLPLVPEVSESPLVSAQARAAVDVFGRSEWGSYREVAARWKQSGWSYHAPDFEPACPSVTLSSSMA